MLRNEGVRETKRNAVHINLNPDVQLAINCDPSPLMSKEFSSITDKDPERPDHPQDPDYPDYSLPSGLSWSSDHDRDNRSQEDCIRSMGVSAPLRLSPRLLLTLASSPSPASRLVLSQIIRTICILFK